jgi:hypothetical protein
MCVADGEVVGRRRIGLIEPGLPCFAYHHGAQGLPIDDGVALVERVRASAVRCAGPALDAFPEGVGAIALRRSPKLPPTVAERIQNYYAQTRTDGVMYRDVLAEAADARGWYVDEYDVKTVLMQAAKALGLKDITARMNETGKSLGPPWQKDHRLAMAVAIVAAGSQRLPLHRGHDNKRRVSNASSVGGTSIVMFSA